MVIIPGLAGDQPFVAAAVHEWKVGRALPGDADAAAMKSAAREVLSEPSYRRNAETRANALAGVDGASNAASAIEVLLRPAEARRLA